jgi:hypothetical protein
MMSRLAVRTRVTVSAPLARLVAAAGCLAVLTGWGCWGGSPSRVAPPSFNASASGQRAMDQYDTDKDGKISGDELKKAPSLNAAAKRIDPSGEGITADKIAARIKTWIDSKCGRVTVVCTIHHKGKPLEGATVTLDPEEFLGDVVQPATGVTSENGVAMMSVPASGPDDVGGVPPGLYLVRVTKSGEKIPAKYNTQTILGLEVASDAYGEKEGYSFDLDY